MTTTTTAKKRTLVDIENDIAKVYSECVEIDEDVIKHFSEEEIKNIKDVLAVRIRLEEQYSGYDNICGGYCNIEVDDTDSDCDDETDEEFEWIMFWIKSGVDGEGSRTSDESYCRISSKVVNDPSLTLGEKAKKVEEA
jgi:hypothetical protein